MFSDQFCLLLISFSIPVAVYNDARGVTWVDDSKATNVEATYAGLMGLKEKKSVVLLGGLSKVMGFPLTMSILTIYDNTHLKFHRIIFLCS